VDANTLSVIDAATDKVTRTIAVGYIPFGVAVDPAARTAYVTDVGSVTGSVSPAALSGYG
jgi:YVTN family beta-propeller protein